MSYQLLIRIIIIIIIIIIVTIIIVKITLMEGQLTKQPGLGIKNNLGHSIPYKNIDHIFAAIMLHYGFLKRGDVRT